MASVEILVHLHNKMGLSLLALLSASPNTILDSKLSLIVQFRRTGGYIWLILDVGNLRLCACRILVSKYMGRSLLCQRQRDGGRGGHWLRVRRNIVQEYYRIEMAQCRLPSWTLVVPVVRLRVSLLVILLVYEQFTGIQLDGHLLLTKWKNHQHSGEHHKRCEFQSKYAFVETT